ncbi:MAG: hypothetical protein IPI37_07360 [Bacteroidales bacterium]|jgi:hypothetical protein|nr:hypothetical protein [Bacteroidales bacterium]
MSEIQTPQMTDKSALNGYMNIGSHLCGTITLSAQEIENVRMKAYKKPEQHL